MIKLGNYFKLLNTPHYFIENDWDSFLKILDVVGIWHYSRSIPDLKSYDINMQKEDVYITCFRTHTKFHFDSDWHCRFSYIDAEGTQLSRTTTEGTLFSTFPYIDVLIDVRAIKFINPFIYL